MITQASRRVTMFSLVLWTVLGLAPAGEAATLWAPSSAPVVADSGADSPVELGVRFTSDSAGYVTGVRFYKGTGNSGTHVGNLWSSTGTLLASAEFNGETASGWQQVNFPTPVRILKDTVYVASYHTNVGHYSADYNYFDTSTDNAPLHAPPSTSGGNGVYSYGSNSTFPTRSYKGTNYWVDLVFEPAPADAQAPVVTAFTLPATSSSLTVPISSFTATDDVGVVGYLVTESPASPDPTAAGWSVTPPPSYTFSSLGGKVLYGWAKDASGKVSASLTASVTITDAGGTPILLLTSSANPFSSYYPEIFRNEGLNEFTVLDVAALTDAWLANYDVVVVGEMPLTTDQVGILTRWVGAGGKLIAMRPDPKLAPLLGLVADGTVLSDAYLQIDTTTPPGAGIVGQTIQFHGAADGYRLDGAASVAALFADAVTPSGKPAVTLRSVGTNGGKAAAFTFDLARSVVYTRQGNPAWAGQERDGYPPIRSNDLFYGPAAADPQNDWVDRNRITIPQADELQRLLANLLIFANQDRKALPRFWYLPKALPAAVVLTGDDHGYGGTMGRFDLFNLVSPQGCRAEYWECVRGTSYLYANTPIGDAAAKSYQDAGFELADHITTNCLDWTPATLRSVFTDQLTAWRTNFPSLAPQVTNRTHCIAWSDYATEPLVELANGIRLDTTYYHLSSRWVDYPVGFFTGSGMPMRFTDAGGNLIDVYQATTQMTDESGQPYPFTIDTFLDRAMGAEGYYGVFTVNAHTDFNPSEVANAVLRSAVSRGVPIISAKQLLQWLDSRNASAFSGISGNSDSLSFSITADPNARGLTVLVPIANGRTVGSIQDGNGLLPFYLARIKGVQYALFQAAAGTYQVQFITDPFAPVVTAVAPAPNATGADTVPVLQASFSKDLDPLSVNSSSFELRDPANLPVPATVSWDRATRTATLIPKYRLATLTTYVATVKGGSGGIADLAGNRLAGDATWTFTTVPTRPAGYSVWQQSSVPATLDGGPDSPVELGTRFRSDTNGTVTAIRFYKAAANAGPHSGHLWDKNGTLLATVTFSNETASGWQQADLSTPVSITANETYVVSYFAPAGHYSITSGAFVDQGVDNVPLHALPFGASGANGCYAYGSTSTFPSQGWHSTNYWVDVVFVPTDAPVGSAKVKVKPVPLAQVPKRTAENLLDLRLPISLR
ncbi:DUF4082 domain-containing protein [Geomesophilobacter sediminis]|uniref:DUF4082 domain-containing protein n=1 Tax=Geomesophilobacter sediminis TaxID=2798584 RepID=A0A8J7JBV5_9BACT|nr:DUF4082 domain-containing protein [Geomesophilobacter sediminis]MBJ6724701.1 DUF4082 domain-containing protein [Geomesophilobacter sediminis]